MSVVDRGSAIITIETRGVKGGQQLLKEFMAGYLQRYPPVLQEVAKQLRSEMQARAPVRTGWLRNNIVWGIPGNNLTVMIKSLAHYSGWVNYGTSRMVSRPYFTDIIDTMAEPAFSERIAQDTTIYLNQLISKYQHGP